MREELPAEVAVPLALIAWAVFFCLPHVRVWLGFKEKK